ncbi:hypothetical protein PoB_003847400 [Plakobranchus ocellatus]|uniref:Uncharacterized protein n=1 Tax=Plakobranchus ocellatus TaxID=259542 RepID=A0AAV4B0T4_9GAST|nr:hypothetical protein PoB_003847400 [Plakobranchus ocellatus]
MSLCFGGALLSCQLHWQFGLSPIQQEKRRDLCGIMFACTNRKKDARERFWSAVDETNTTGKLHHQILNHSIASLNQPISLRNRFRADRVNPAAARQTLKQFWWPLGRPQSVFGGRYRDSRVFLE